MRLGTICVAAMSFLVACTKAEPPEQPPAAANAPAASLVGAWENRLQFTTGAFAPIKDLRLLYSFNQGGTMTESSDYDEVPPVPPAYGVWRQVGPNKFEAKYVFYQTKPPATFKDITSGNGWLPTSRGILSESINVAADGNSFESTLKYDAFDMADKPTTGGGVATGHASRISF